MFSEYENGYVITETTLTGDIYLRVTMPEKGRVAIRRITKERSPVIYCSPYAADDYRIRLYGDTVPVTIRIITTAPPTHWGIWQI